MAKKKVGGNKAPKVKKATPAKAKSFAKAKGTKKDGNSYGGMKKAKRGD